LALLPVVAAPVGCEPGIMHVVWQLAAWELHTIMQFVTFEVCARRIRVAACTLELQIANAAVHKITPAMQRGCMMLSLISGQSKRSAATRGMRRRAPATPPFAPD
jgi:hypothetical protein